MAYRRVRETGGGRRTLIGYVLVAGAVLLASLGGYVGYVLYPRFELPAVTVLGLFILAAGAGVASFFSPCSFPLLISLFGRAPGQDRSQPLQWKQTLPFAGSLAAGATAFLLITGSIIAVAGTRIFEGVVFTSTEGVILRTVVGVILILLGLIQIRLLPVPIPSLQDLADPLVDQTVSASGRPGVGRVSLFGFGYLVAGFG